MSHPDLPNLDLDLAPAPDPQPVTEVVVQAGEVALMTRHRDAQQAVFRAFQAVLDRIE